MRTSAFVAGETFAQLRRHIAALGETKPLMGKEGERTASSHVAHARAPPLAPRRAGATLPFAIPKLDALLAGGLRCAALHELRVAESRDAAAMTGFAAAILARLGENDPRPILWIL